MRIKYYNKYYDFKDDCPDKVTYYYKNRIKEIPKEIYYQYVDFWLSCKKFVVGRCDISGLETRTQICSLQKRNYFKNRLIHESVILREVCNTDEWRNKNSNAQLIAQNKPGQRKKNSESVKNAWKNEKLSKRWRESIKKSNQSLEHRQKIGEASKKLWMNEEYRAKMLDKFTGFRGISGVFHSKFSGKIRFDSTYEFFYIFKKDLERNKLLRFDKEIKYIIRDKIKGYRPDFIDNENNIIEIKSSWIKEYKQELEELSNKRNSALNYVRDNNCNDFYLLEEKDLKSLEHFNIREHIMFLMLQNEHILLHNGKIKEFKIETENLKKARELINKWNLLK